MADRVTKTTRQTIGKSTGVQDTKTTRQAIGKNSGVMVTKVTRIVIVSLPTVFNVAY